MSGRTSARIRWAAPSSATSAGDHGDAEPVAAPQPSAAGVARDDRHLGALVNEGLDQP